MTPPSTVCGDSHHPHLARFGLGPEVRLGQSRAVRVAALIWRRSGEWISSIQTLSRSRDWLMGWDGLGGASQGDDIIINISVMSH